MGGSGGANTERTESDGTEESSLLSAHGPRPLVSGRLRSHKTLTPSFDSVPDPGIAWAGTNISCKRGTPVTCLEQVGRARSGLTKRYSSMSALAFFRRAPSQPSREPVMSPTGRSSASGPHQAFQIRTNSFLSKPLTSFRSRAFLTQLEPFAIRIPLTKHFGLSRPGEGRRANDTLRRQTLQLWPLRALNNSYAPDLIFLTEHLACPHDDWAAARCAFDGSFDIRQLRYQLARPPSSDAVGIDGGGVLDASGTRSPKVSSGDLATVRQCSSATCSGDCRPAVNHSRRPSATSSLSECGAPLRTSSAAYLVAHSGRGISCNPSIRMS